MISRIYNYITNIQQDKLLHMLFGYIIMVISSLMFNPLISLCITAVIAVGKEVYDKYHVNHTCDMYDIYYTIAGAIPVLILTL